MTMPAETARYFAFISYSHQDELWATWLHKALETYRVPSRLVGQTTAAGTIPRRLLPIFRDRDELASATDLGRKVNDALAHSANLIVICSPQSARSRWVNEEVLAFKRLGNAERIFCLIVGGEPNASDLAGREAEECFAPALRFELGADGQPTRQRTEPIAADARAGKDGKPNAKLKLIAGMLDVGFDTLKQRELQRRNRRMAVVTAAALLIMAITTTLAITAVIARNDAERRQKQAEDLVGFMLGDLNDKLREVARLDILEAVDDKAMAYFSSLPKTDVTDEALEQRAKAFEKIGSVRMDQGHMPAAMEAFQAALDLSGSLARAAPDDAGRQIAYSRVWAYAGMGEWSQGRLDAAQKNFESAQSVLQVAEKRAPDNPELLYQLTSIENNVGHVLEARGKLDEAEAQYRRMLAHCEKLVAGRAGNALWTVQLGAAHNNLGKVALMRGDLAAAIAEYAADDAIESHLSKNDPKNNDQREDAFRVRAILGRMLALVGDVRGGMRAYEEAIDIGTQLLALDQSNTNVQENLSLYRMQLGRLYRLAGEPAKAGALTAAATGAFAALIKQDPANVAWQREYAEVLTERAAQSAGNGDTASARKQLQDALEILDPMFAKQPDNRSVLLATLAAKSQLAAIGADGEATRTIRQEVLAALKTVQSGGDDPRLLALHVDALLGLGNRDDAQALVQKLWSSGYGDVAFVALLKRQGIDYPVNTAFQQKLQTAKADQG
jgi:tetratricopeptide (TPR) repeat protein